MIDNLTHNLNEMIRHQRLAEQDTTHQDYHHAEAMRYRLEAIRLEKQLRVTRLLISEWIGEN